MNLNEFEKELNNLIACRYRPFAGAIATYAFNPRDKDKGFFSCRWLFSDTDQEPRSDIDYGMLYLGEEWFSGESVVASLIDIMSGNKSLGSYTTSPSIELVSDTLYIPQSFSYTGWREWFFQAKLKDHNASFPSDPIVKRGLRPYLSGTHAIMDWIWQGTINLRFNEPRHVNEIVILLPDTRGRIASAEWHIGSVKVKIEDNIHAGELELQGIATSQSQEKTISSSSTEKEVEWELGKDVGRVELFLVHSDESLLSRVYLRRPGDEFSSIAGELSLEKQAEIDLRTGEDEQVEYKPFIRLNDSKENEIIETIVAFSNGSGGRIYIGVNDNGTPQAHAVLCAVGKGSPEDAIETLVSRMKKIIREKIKPVPNVSVEELSVFGERIILALIAPGNETPYATHENDVYLRKGSSNMKPDPRTELPQLYEKSRRDDISAFTRR